MPTKEPRTKVMKPVRFLYFLGILMALIGFAGSAILVQAAPPLQSAEEGQQLFQKFGCIACHTIGGGKLVGPDLKDVTTRQDHDWLVAFIKDPGKMIADQDPIAVALLKEYNNVMMPTLGLQPAQIESILAYLASASSGGTAPSQPAAQVAVTPGDAARGESLFLGTSSQANAGPACTTCHTVQNVNILVGGSLGPDLTHVLGRYGGEAGLASSLAGLPFPTMQGIFMPAGLSPQDQADLLAFFIQADQTPLPQAVQPLTWVFFGIGVAGALLFFILMLINWPRQRRSLSEQLRSRPVV